MKLYASVTCANDHCFDELQIEIINGALWRQEVAERLEAEGWREQSDGVFCPRHAYSEWEAA